MGTALAFFAATLYVSIRYLAKPHGFMDWTVQLTGATIAAVIGFFLMWGHWQSPVHGDDAIASNADTVSAKVQSHP
jgi:hypothetical protein